MTRLAFALDTPGTDRLDRITRFSGWWLDTDPVRRRSLRIVVDGHPAAALLPVLRPDVGMAIPDEPRAAAAGFLGDLVLPSGYSPGDTARVAICAGVGAATETTLCEREMIVAESATALPAPARAIDLAEVLQHPEHASLSFVPLSFDNAGMNGAVPVVAGVPHFHPAGALPVYRLLDTEPTHRLGPMLEQLLGELRGLALDFGAGVPGSDRLRTDVVNLDALHFPGIDVCSSYPRLPFRDRAFELVLSLAVFEHLPDPRAAALEVARVLKRGGLFFVDTAFLQPLHGDPDHFFNMTMSGLRRILDGFEIVDIGMKVNHAPSKSLAMQIEAVLPLMQQGRWNHRLRGLLAELREQGAELDDALGAIGRETLAAGYYALARRL
jgi:hypothetical protein